MILKTLLVTAFLAILPISVNADQNSDGETLVKECVQKNTSEQDYRDIKEACVGKIAWSCKNSNTPEYCYKTETAVWQKLLDEEYKELSAQLNASQNKKLAAMKNKWSLFKKSACEFSGVVGFDGSLCDLYETAAQLNRLKQYSRNAILKD